MELTKKHKVMLAVLAVGAGVITIDRAFVLRPGPSTASAAGPDLAAQSAERAPGDTTQAEPAPQGRVLLADRVDALAAAQLRTGGGAGLVDPFGIVLATRGSAEGQAGEQVARQEPEPDLKVTAVMTRPRAVAIINGVPLEMGKPRRVELPTVSGAGSTRWSDVEVLSVREPQRGDAGAVRVRIDGLREVELVIRPTDR